MCKVLLQKSAESTRWAGHLTSLHFHDSPGVQCSGELRAGVPERRGLVWRERQAGAGGGDGPRHSTPQQASGAEGGLPEGQCTMPHRSQTPASPSLLLLLHQGFPLPA